MSLVNQQPRHAVSDAGVRTWLDAFSAAVRAVDFEAARALFDADVVSFGTFARKVVGIDKLVDGQWKVIWGCTRNFRFLMDEAYIEINGEVNGEASGSFAWIATPWMSQGRDERGTWYDRAGRCTLVLRRVDGPWRCVHSHFSREPAPKLRGEATPT